MKAYGHDVVRNWVRSERERCTNSSYHRRRDEPAPIATHTVSWCQGSRWRARSHRITRNYCADCAHAFARRFALIGDAIVEDWT